MEPVALSINGATGAHSSLTHCGGLYGSGCIKHVGEAEGRAG